MVVYFLCAGRCMQKNKLDIVPGSSLLNAGTLNINIGLIIKHPEVRIVVFIGTIKGRLYPHQALE